uniref:Uncharacterized protein n=1 Tax=Arundo donax TaxID=35708 RepID=A0A0A9D349_ARUDO
MPPPPSSSPAPNFTVVTKYGTTSTTLHPFFMAAKSSRPGILIPQWGSDLLGCIDAYDRDPSEDAASAGELVLLGPADEPAARTAQRHMEGGGAAAKGGGATGRLATAWW